MKTHGFEEVAHTADRAIKVWAEDFNSLLCQSARGMYGLMDITPDPTHQFIAKFTIIKSNRETVLVDFLNELLFRVEEKLAMYENFSFTKEVKGLQVTAYEYPIKAFQREIKAVTFHNLVIKDMDFGVMTTITFDV